MVTFKEAFMRDVTSAGVRANDADEDDKKLLHKRSQSIDLITLAE